jgi:hypothetical protein
MWLKGFKAVRAENRKLMSAFEDYECVRYIRHKPTYPKEWCGPLVVIDNLSDALDFIKRHPQFTLYHCLYKESIEGSVWRLNDSHCPLMNIKQCYHGSALASSVTITHKVSKKDIDKGGNSVL